MLFITRISRPLVCLLLILSVALGVQSRRDTAARAAGPLVFDETTGTPILWPNGEVFYNLDSGPLGAISEEQAQILVRTAFRNWTDIPSVALRVRDAGPIRDIDGQVVDVTRDNLDRVIDLQKFLDGVYPEPDGQSPVIFDNDGRIFDLLFGGRSGVIAIAGYEIISAKPAPRAVEGIAFFNGTYVDNNPDNSIGADFTPEEFQGAVTHEIGHYLGLGHSQVNGPSIIFGRDLFGYPEAPLDSIETMNPFTSPRTGPAAGTPARDDIAALSALYPVQELVPSTGRITGRVFLSDAVTPLQGANVVARNVKDPYYDAVSQLSGARYVPLLSGSAGTSKPPGPRELENFYELTGLTPDADYVVLAEPTGGGSFSSTVTFGFPSDFFNGEMESGNPATDKALDRTPIAVRAGATAENVNIVFNADRENSLLVNPQPAVAAPEGGAALVTIGIPYPAPKTGIPVKATSLNPAVFGDVEAMIPGGRTAVTVEIPRRGPGGALFDVTAERFETVRLVVGAAEKQPAFDPLPAQTPGTAKLAVGEILVANARPALRFRVRLFNTASTQSVPEGTVLAELPELRGPTSTQGRITQMAFSRDGKTLYVAHGFAGTTVLIQTSPESDPTTPSRTTKLKETVGTPVIDAGFQPGMPIARSLRPVQESIPPIAAKSAVVWRLTDADGNGVAEKVDSFETGTADIQDLAVVATPSGEALVMSCNYVDADAFFNRPSGTVAPLRPAILAFLDSDRDGTIDGGDRRVLASPEDLQNRDLTELSGGLAFDPANRLLFAAQNRSKPLGGIFVMNDTDNDGLPDRVSGRPFLLAGSLNSPINAIARLRVRSDDGTVFFTSAAYAAETLFTVAGDLFAAPDRDRNGVADRVNRVADDLGTTIVSPNITNGGLELDGNGDVFVVGAFPGFRSGPILIPQYVVYRVTPQPGNVAKPRTFVVGPAVDVEGERSGFFTGLARWGG